MDLHGKLAELKDLHDKGLITPEVYAAQQAKLLADGAGDRATATPSSGSGRALMMFAGLVAVLIAGMWVLSTFASRSTSDTVRQLASQTGIGKQVIPWSDLADTAARNLVAANDSKIAAAIVASTNATGKEAKLMDTKVSKLEDKIIVELTVGWKGGFAGQPYKTVVEWEIAKADHVAAKVLADTSPFPPSAEDRNRLDNYFRTKVYPAFYSDVSGNPLEQRMKRPFAAHGGSKVMLRPPACHVIGSTVRESKRGRQAALVQWSSPSELSSRSSDKVIVRQRS